MLVFWSSNYLGYYNSRKVSCQACFSSASSALITVFPSIASKVSTCSSTTLPILAQHSSPMILSKLAACSLCTVTKSREAVSEKRSATSVQPASSPCQGTRDRSMAIPKPPAKELSAAATASPPSERSWHE